MTSRLHEPGNTTGVSYNFCIIICDKHLIEGIKEFINQYAGVSFLPCLHGTYNLLEDMGGDPLMQRG